MRHLAVVIAVTVACITACGRVGFQPLEDGGPGTGADGAAGDGASGVSCTAAVAPPRGTVCDSGALYAGEWGGSRYMVTPAGCTDSTTPVCDGSVDSLQKTWFGTGGMFTNIPGVENVLGGGATVLGDVNTAAAAAHTSVTADSAIRYCADLELGGFTDWYLPASHELVFVLVCHSNSPGVNNVYPIEDPNCASVGGKTSELGGFTTGHYWASTESDSGGTAGRRLQFGDPAVRGDNFKDQLQYVRCIRRF